MRIGQYISVIIPVWNGEKYLREGIESVLEQTYRHIELIIVDDGSNDSSAEIARSYEGIRYIRQDRQGVTVARNTGIMTAGGDFIAFLDQDDIWTPNKLDMQISYLHKCPEVGYVLAMQKLFLQTGTAAPSWLKENLLRQDQIGYLPGTLLVRRSVIEQVGLFDPFYKIGSDADWFIRARDSGVPMAILPEVLLLRRIHQCNQSAQTDIVHPELIRMLKSSIKRRNSLKYGRTSE